MRNENQKCNHNFYIDINHVPVEEDKIEKLINFTLIVCNMEKVIVLKNQKHFQNELIHMDQTIRFSVLLETQNGR